MLKIVVIKLAAPNIEDAPAKCNENIARSIAIPGEPVEPDSGGYIVHPTPTPPSITADNNNNLQRISTVPLKTAAFGGEIVINTLDDRSIKVKIAPGTQSGTKLRIPESGLPRRNMPNADLLIEIKVIIPKLDIPDLYKTVQDVL